MARAQGARALMALAFETTYGTPPASGFTRMPFASTSLGAEQPLLNSELLGYGRDPLAPIKDAVTAAGDVVVPLDAAAMQAAEEVEVLERVQVRLQRRQMAEIGEGAGALQVVPDDPAHVRAVERLISRHTGVPAQPGQAGGAEGHRQRGGAALVVFLGVEGRRRQLDPPRQAGGRGAADRKSVV